MQWPQIVRKLDEEGIAIAKVHTLNQEVVFLGYRGSKAHGLHLTDHELGVDHIREEKAYDDQVTQEVVQPPPEPDRKPLSIDEHKEIIEQTEDKSKIALLGDVSQGLKRADNVPDSAPANQRYIPDPGVYEIMYLNNIPDTNFRLVEMRILREDGSKKWADRHWDVEPGDWGFRIDMGGWKDGTYTYQLYVNDAFIREKHFSIDNGIVSQREAITVGPE